MSTFLQVFINGAGKGAVYALLALGFVIIYKSTEVINFAHGSIAMAGGYIVYVLKDPFKSAMGSGLGWTLAALCGILAAAVLALLIERVLVANARLASIDALAILTIGVDTLLLTEITRRLGTAAAPFLGDPYDAKPIHLGSVTLPKTQTVALITALIIIAIFFAAFRLTNWGVSMRAQAENREASALMGIRSARITAGAWFLGGALAGVAVLFLATQDFSGAGLSQGTHSIALAAFPAAIIGGLTSPGGAVLGGFIVGLAEAFSAQYIDLDFSKVAVYLVMLVVLIVRPSGLFGKVVQQRV
ncbi:MAG: branched-chain amino acid ABC transporter permease [Antricoccus sp.]